MDPDATLARLIDAAVEGDARELSLAAHDLTNHLRAGGFPPKDPRIEVATENYDKGFQDGQADTEHYNRFDVSPDP